MDGHTLLTMTWLDTVFAHWPVSPERVQSALPDGLDVAVYDDEAWLGVVAFEMADIRPRGSPVGFSFYEANLRTYVRPSEGGERGVYFFNLDASDAISVALARSLFALPYYRSRAGLSRRDDGSIRVTSTRIHSGATPMHLDATYRPTGEPAEAEPGSLDAFLAENYCFYTVGSERFRGDIDHAPWRLREAEIDIHASTVFESNGFEQPDGEPLVHYARRVDVDADRIRRVR